MCDTSMIPTSSASGPQIPSSTAEEIAALLNLVSNPPCVLDSIEPSHAKAELNEAAGVSQQGVEIVLNPADLNDPNALQQRIAGILAQLQAGGDSQRIVIRTESKKPPNEQRASMLDSVAQLALETVKRDPEVASRHVTLSMTTPAATPAVAVTNATPTIVNGSDFVKVLQLSQQHQQQQQQQVFLVNKPVTQMPVNSGAASSSSSGSSGGVVLIPLDRNRAAHAKRPVLPKVEQARPSPPATSQSHSSPWQQYIKQFTKMGPCPVCGDKISGYHYGIFCCESCKGFFKRTVQNAKVYACHRSGQRCEMNILTRKKCPACRLQKCLDKGMKVEAIRGDRTRGGRSLYHGMRRNLQTSLTTEPAPAPPPSIELPRCIAEAVTSEKAIIHEEDTLELGDSSDEAAVYRALLLLAEQRLYRLVRWSRHLPVFNSVSTEDQIVLLQNCWIELLCFDCCWRSLQTPAEIRLTSNKCINLEAARELGADAIVSEILGLTAEFCRLGLGLTEYACLKVVVLMQPEVHDLTAPDKVRTCLDEMCQALKDYTLANSPDKPSKFAELFLKVAHLKRAANMAWEILASKDLSPFLQASSLLIELLKSDKARGNRR